MAIKRVVYKAKGLYTYHNQFDAPDGAMSVASGIFLDRPGVIESARAWISSAYAYTLTGANTGISDMYSVNGTVFALEARKTIDATNPRGISLSLTDSRLARLDGFGGTNEITPTDGDGVTTHHVAQRPTACFSANNNTYFIFRGIPPYNGTYDYLRWTGTANNQPQSRGLGMPEAPAPQAYLAVAAGDFPGIPSGLAAPNGTQLVTSTMSATSQRAYRVLFVQKDTNNNLIRGAPSGRYIVYAPTANYALQVLGVNRLYANDIVQVYASEIQPITADEPSDDMRQVFEHIVSAADVTRGYIQCDDLSPDSLRGAALYTNDTQDGILMAEGPPPPCSVAEYFKNVAWYGGQNYRGYVATTLTILGVSAWISGTAAIVIRVNAVDTTYTSGAAENFGTKTFKLYASGSPAQNNFNTARSLCRVINQTNTSVLASMVTPPGGTAAQILFKYGVNAVNTHFTPDYSLLVGLSGYPSLVMPLGAGLAGTTAPDIAQADIFFTPEDGSNRLYFSKPNQPEAVPDLNYVPVGQTGYPIIGLKSIRDSLFVFKQDGLFRVTGTTLADIRVEPFDQTVSMVLGQHKSIAATGNRIFALCSQGVVSITETGCTIVSMPIDDTLASYVFLSNDPAAPRVAGGIGCGSDSERKYFLILKPSGTITNAQATLLIYNYLNDAWSSHSPSGAPSCLARVVGSLEDVFVSNASSGTVQLLTEPSLTSQTYVASSWTYLYGQQNPATAKRFYTVKLNIQGSGTITTASAAFSSDSGASPITVTPTVYSTGLINFHVPPEHANCSRLSVAFTITPESGSKLMVHSAEFAFDEIGDWSVK